MRNAGGGSDTGGRPSGSSGRPAGADDQQPPSGGASLFTPAYRVSHAPEGRQPGQDAAHPAYDDSRYGHSAADSAGSGYQWSGGPKGGGYDRGGYDRPEYGQAYDRGGYEHAGYGDLADGSGWPDADPEPSYSWSAGDPDAWPGSSLQRDGFTQPVASNAVRGLPPAPGDSLPVYPPGPFAAWNRAQPGRADGRDQADRQGLTDGSQLATATITPTEFDTDYSIPAIKDPIPGHGERRAEQDRRRAAAGAAETAAPPTVQRPREPGPASHGGRAKRKGGGAAGRGRKKKRQTAWLAIGTACVIIVAVAAILVVTIPRGSTPPASHHKPSSSPTPASSSPTPPPGPWGFIGSRVTDTVPLTAAELYPASISAAGTTYTRAKQAKSAACRAALIGSALQASVRKGGCTQALRATYLSKTAKVMATIGVFNLKNAAAASKAAAKAGHAEFVAQLAAKSGPAKSIGQGTGLEEAIVKGHYLVLVWAETTNLSPPKGQAGRTHLTAFMNLLVKRTVNVSLSNRMVDGKPVAAG
jgi:hypothetical protein